MPSYIAVLRLDESSTGWALSYGDAKNRDYNVTSNPMPLKLLYESDGEKRTHLGYEAEWKHADLKRSNAQTGYYFFTNIVSLLRKTLRKNVDENKVFIEDITGKCFPAINLLTIIIQSLLDGMKRQLSSQYTFDVKKDLYFVIVVPALLQESRGLNLITKAAIKAEIDEKMVSVVTDIDAISLFCQCASSYGFSSEDTNLFVRLGDTTDIMKQGPKPDCSKGGSSIKSFQNGMLQVEEAIENFMIQVFGEEVFEKFKALESSEYFDMKRYVGTKLRIFSKDNVNVRLKIPFELLDTYKDINKINFADDARKFRDLRMLIDKLEIPTRKFMGFLEKTKKSVLSHIEAELKTEKLNKILIFGQLAETAFIQEEVKLLQRNIKVISETDIILGAVIVGKSNTPGQIIKLAPRTIMVASIDLGTAYSGWAYSFFSDFKSDRTKISARHWNSGSIQTPKNPTCLLVKPDGKTIESFGYEAENRYGELIEDNKHASYYFFRRFKMVLNRKLGEKINRDLVLEDEMGRSLLAIDVFSMSIRFLKDDVLEDCNKRHSGAEIMTQDVQWVLTVPAIWNDGAKQFMRESALKAGIESRRLTLALEPESASIYCRHQNISAGNKETGDKDISCFKEGTRYIIIDAGGGTVDITIHEVGKNGNIKEVHAACGGDWGGTAVDKEFETVLLELIGTQILKRFKNENMEDYLELWRDFEVKKKTIAPSSIRVTKMTIPVSLMETFKAKTHKDLAKSISKTHYAKDIEIKSGNKMAISANMMRSFFTNSINSIIPFVRSILESENVQAVLMVGGYSESIMLQEAVKTNFPEIEIVVPDETSYSVMKGAIIFGFIPTIISKRVLKYTYGVRVAEKFLKGKHPESKRLQTDAGDRCKDIFDKHVEKDQEVNVGETQVWRFYTPLYKTQEHLNILVFASEKSNPEYTDKDCHFVGEMIVDLSDSGALDRKIEVALSFSCTEIVIVAKEMKTGKETHATIDFLG